MAQFHIITYGCQMNDLDSQIIEGLLVRYGHVPTDLEDADLAIMVTCCVRKTAEDRAFGRLGYLRKWKSERSGRIVIFAGCIAQKDQGEVKKRFDHVDYVVGPRNIYDIPDLIADHVRESLQVSKIDQPDFSKVVTYRRSRFKASVNITFGCNNFCTYCIVPYVRGREISRNPDDIMTEIEALAANGISEITLLGQNVNSYSYQGVNFAALLEKVAQIQSVRRIRFVSSHPKDFNEDIVKVMAEYPNIANSLHLAMQSGSNHVLDRMNRKYTIETYLDKIKMLRSHIPDVALSTDVIVGFPGETKDDYQQTVDRMREIEFDLAFMFLYNVREGTVAADFDGQLPYDVKQKRLADLIEIQKGISIAKNEKLIGETVEVLVSHPSPRYPGQYVGKTKTEKNVVFDYPVNPVGTYLKVWIEEAFAHTLRGEVVESC